MCACAIELALSDLRDLQTLTVASAEEAWALLEGRGGPFHAVVTDIHLRDMDGLDLIRRIRAHGVLRAPAHCRRQRLHRRGNVRKSGIRRRSRILRKTLFARPVTGENGAASLS